ncbi:hypothetical protein KM043_012501 [Ampulex compressa]|nr:hypothetical protein KM043_012501 [Ampulex compressa]
MVRTTHGAFDAKSCNPFPFEAEAGIIPSVTQCSRNRRSDGGEVGGRGRGAEEEEEEEEEEEDEEERTKGRRVRASRQRPIILRGHSRSDKTHTESGVGHVGDTGGRGKEKTSRAT